MGYYMARVPYVVNQFTWLLFQETVPETLISREDFLLTYDFVLYEVLMYPLRYFPCLRITTEYCGYKDRRYKYP